MAHFYLSTYKQSAITKRLELNKRGRFLSARYNAQFHHILSNIREEFIVHLRRITLLPLVDIYNLANRQFPQTYIKTVYQILKRKKLSESKSIKIFHKFYDQPGNIFVNAFKVDTGKRKIRVISAIDLHTGYLSMKVLNKDEEFNAVDFLRWLIYSYPVSIHRIITGYYPEFTHLSNNREPQFTPLHPFTNACIHFGLEHEMVDLPEQWRVEDIHIPEDLLVHCVYHYGGFYKGYGLVLKRFCDSCNANLTLTHNEGKSPIGKIVSLSKPNF